jgi:predicted metal-binding membrane protein
MLTPPDIGRRTYAALSAILAMAAIAAWGALLWRLPEPGPFAVVWAALTMAILLPAATPMVATYSALRREIAGIPRVCAGAAAFVAGYLGPWVLAGIAGYAVVELLGIEWAPYAGGFVLVAAAGYQLTPLKRRCLARCRVPMSFMLTSWRDGETGAFAMGLRLAGWCIGSSCALMAALYALGGLSLAWMALVALLIAAERIAPVRDLAARGVAGVLFAAGLAIPALSW